MRILDIPFVAAACAAMLFAACNPEAPSPLDPTDAGLIPAHCIRRPCRTGEDCMRFEVCAHEKYETEPADWESGSVCQERGRGTYFACHRGVCTALACE